MRAGRGSSAWPASRALLLLALSCADRGSSPPHGALPPGVAARVGADQVRLATVGRIAEAQGISPQKACERAISDALLAAALRSDPAQAPRVAAAERSVLARRVLEGLRDDARRLGPPADAELATLVAQRWPELDRPVSVATAHAVVLVKKPTDDASARALAQGLAAALKGAASGAELIARATAFPKGTLEIHAEHLPPATPDGRIWDPDERPPKPLPGTLDLDFTRAAQLLAQPGDQSDIVKSAFGYHVILLERRYPELRLKPEEQRAKLAEDVQSRRAKHALELLITSLRQGTNVSTDRAVEALTALVPVTP